MTLIRRTPHGDRGLVGAYGRLTELYHEQLLRAETAENRPALFQRGHFTLASGRESLWKIECDALTADDWKGIAEMACDRFGLPGDVSGVPRGGIPFAEALKPYRCFSLGALWVLDDVVTTGGSMAAHLATVNLEDVQSSPLEPPFCLAVFSRGGPDWVDALFRMGV